MPKIRKLKRRKTFKANINRKRLRNKLRKLPDIGCEDIKAAWVETKSTRQNLRDMGLAYDPNEALKIPNAKQEILQKSRHKTPGDSSGSEDEKDTPHVPSKAHVAADLESQAKAPRERMFRLPNQQVQFVTYLMDKYGDDYKAMARDKKNYYQMTWRQIRAKINTFKGVPEQYAEYLLKKGDIVLEDPTPLEETRKRIAEENVKKFCAPKPKKVKKPAKSQWLEEDEDMDFDTGDKLEDVDDEDMENSEAAEPEKKLKLFSDDEGEDQEGDEKRSKKKLNGKLRDAKAEKKLQLISDDDDDDQEGSEKKSKKKSNGKLQAAKNGKEKPRSAEIEIPTKINKGTISKKAKTLEVSPSSDSESDEELEGDDEEAGFVDLNELSDEELSEDDALDDEEFVTESDDSD